jgi:methylated-DNA-[protein]-cysteine S-methyltransferase
MHPSCRNLEPDLVAAATGEAPAGVGERIQTHIARCAPCRDEFERYRAIDGVCDRLRDRTPEGGDEIRARQALVEKLGDLRSRVVAYGIVPSRLGNILIARSEHGVALVEYLGTHRSIEASRLARAADVEPVADGADVERLGHELLEYLEGRRTHLDWTLDLRLARGDFDRMVLDAASRIPYGAVTSYARLARAIGKPFASRAVAQALRWNPVPVVVPCHRIVGSSGALVGYAGNKLGLKRDLLTVEGVPTRRAPDDWHVARNTMYVQHLEGQEYCRPTCGSLPRMTLAELTLFGSREHAEAVGLAPCTECRPDVESLLT